MSHAFRVVIPARYASTRLPGKPLRNLLGKSMLQHVYEAASQCGARQVVIATDDDRIEVAAKGFDAEVCMTSPEHASGTDRLAEVVAKLGWPDDDIVVNVQGDEPLMPPALIDQVASDLADCPEASISTIATPMVAAGEFFDSNVVKVVTDRAGFALYFSRASIPWDRDLLHDGVKALPIGIVPLRHIGIYAYRVAYLHRYAQMRACPLEQAEHLEQLRALWYGERIHVAQASQRPGPGVDTEEDLVIAEQLLHAKLNGSS
ncbi:MAG TPA: 3-deoxy-manno-octulosonate cytidylyltransferase [Gammaproteobacteria bacterium]|nr:3-deoxy-manno-octulosonate cytidylyltransferase [Gammaproteobacteria bacterium]